MDDGSIIVRDVWIRYTDRNGSSFTQMHRVWDIGRFMAARSAEAVKQGGKVEQVMKPAQQKRG